MENKRLFGKICYLHRQLIRENNRLFSEYGVTPVQMHAMIIINKHAQRGNVCQKDLERELNLRASTISTLISNLEKDGFLTRTVAEDDARTKYLVLTEKGCRLCAEDKKFMDSCDAALAAALNSDEQQAFDTLLTKIIDNIQ